jgi:hypothetical protein
MPNLTVARVYQPQSYGAVPLPLAAGAKATRGGMACIDTTAKVATPGAAANANLIRVGTWMDNVDNTAGTTTTMAMVRLDYEIWGYWWDNATGSAAVTAANQLFTTAAYILDDHTVTNAASGNSSAGRVWAVSPDGAKVFVQESRIG